MYFWGQSDQDQECKVCVLNFIDHAEYLDLSVLSMILHWPLALLHSFFYGTKMEAVSFASRGQEHFTLRLPQNQRLGNKSAVSLRACAWTAPRDWWQIGLLSFQKQNTCKPFGISWIHFVSFCYIAWWQGEIFGARRQYENTLLTIVSQRWMILLIGEWKTAPENVFVSLHIFIEWEESFQPEMFLSEEGKSPEYIRLADVT